MNETENVFGCNNSHLALDVWILSSVIQLATFDFCKRFLTEADDPCGRQFDQMTQAARSGQANIAEGLARGKTSRETELKLLDVARASLAELSGDFTFWLMRRNEIPWAKTSPESTAIMSVRLERAHYETDWVSESCAHVLKTRALFTNWLASDDDRVCANALLLLIERTSIALGRLMSSKLESFKAEGGFTESLTRMRLAARDAATSTPDAPKCPICGKEMRRRLAKKGRNAGNVFWSCSDYPNCCGTRNC